MTSSISNLALLPFQNFNSKKAEKKIVKFIRRTVRRSGSCGVVLGLSGGIDSALAAVLSAKAIGAENVFPIFFYDSVESESNYFSSQDLQDAELLCNRFGLSLQKINLHSVFDSAQSSFDSIKTPESVSISSGNLKSRLRMSLLYYYANQNNLLVLGTKNKTERFTGYFTKYGDGGVDLDPIADLYKTEVRLLSAYLSIPAEILEKTPSAGFWAGQSDEADLGVRYEQLDSLLLELEKSGSIYNISKPKKKSKFNQKKILQKTGLTKEQYFSLLSRFKSAEHKQKLPPFPKIS
jgi:NAD+ synthetase